MPYIKQDSKDRLLMDGGNPETAGELNYLFTELAIQYWQRRGNYAAINDVVGALEGAKLEFYRRVAAPYEDTKIAENGDVY